MASTHDLLLRMPREWLENEFRRSCMVMPRVQPMAGNSVCRVLGRHPMEILCNDIGCSTHLALDGFWEMWITMAIARNVGCGSYCFDVGANVGYYSVLMGAVMECRVEAFEPQSMLRSLIEFSTAMNGCHDRVTVHDCALGDKTSMVDLFLDSDTANATLICAESESDFKGTKKVGVVPADSVIPPGTVVDFMKIDVEGFEPQVIEGMKRIIEQSPRLQICLEWTPSKYECPERFLDTMLEKFQLMMIEGDGELRAATAADQGRILGLGELEFEMVWFRRK